jgi:hypothetical protein
MNVTSHCDECEKEFELDELKYWRCYNCRTMIPVVEFSVQAEDLVEYFEISPKLKKRLIKSKEEYCDDYLYGFYFYLYNKNQKYMIWVIDDYNTDECKEQGITNTIIKDMRWVNGSSCFGAWLCNFGDDYEFHKDYSISQILDSINSTKKKMIEDTLVSLSTPFNSTKKK